MASHEKRFFRKGVDKQKRADIVFIVKRPDREKIKEWTVSERLLLKAFVADMQRAFDDFKKELQ